LACKMHVQQREGRVTLSSDPAMFSDLRKQIADGTLRMRGNRSIEQCDRERGTMLIELLAIPSTSEKAAIAGGGAEARRK
jgi:hypothetical protein